MIDNNSGSALATVPAAAALEDVTTRRQILVRCRGTLASGSFGLLCLVTAFICGEAAFLLEGWQDAESGSATKWESGDKSPQSKSGTCGPYHGSAMLRGDQRGIEIPVRRGIEVGAETEFFFKYTPPISEAPKLFAMLQASGYDAGRLFPGYGGAAMAVINDSRIANIE